MLRNIKAFQRDSKQRDIPSPFKVRRLYSLTSVSLIILSSCSLFTDLLFSLWRSLSACMKTAGDFSINLKRCDRLLISGVVYRQPGGQTANTLNSPEYKGNSSFWGKSNNNNNNNKIYCQWISFQGKTKVSPAQNARKKIVSSFIDTRLKFKFGDKIKSRTNT